MSSQIAVNSQALINLAAKLEQLGYTGPDVHRVAESIALNLLADGYRPLEKPPPPRPERIATDAERRAAMTTIRTELGRGKR